MHSGAQGKQNREWQKEAFMKDHKIVMSDGMRSIGMTYIKALESTSLSFVDSLSFRNPALPYFSIKGHPYQTIPAIACLVAPI